MGNTKCYVAQPAISSQVCPADLHGDDPFLFQIGSQKKPSSGLISSIWQQQLQRRRQTTAGAFQDAMKCLAEFDEREEDDIVPPAHTSSQIFHTSPRKSSSSSLLNTQKCLLTSPPPMPATQPSSLSDVDKVLSRCTTSQILPLQDLYHPHRLCQSRKVCI